MRISLGLCSRAEIREPSASCRGAVGNGLGQVIGHAQEFPIFPDACGAVRLGHAVDIGYKFRYCRPVRKSYRSGLSGM